MAAHARYSPSKSEQWMTCHASLAFEHQLGLDGEGQSSEYADEGTAAHTVGSECLKDGTDAARWLDIEVPVLNDDGTVRRKFVCTQEMTDNVQVYLDEVRSRVAPGDILLVEQRVSLTRTLGIPDQGGTADAIILHADSSLTIIDLKYGAGIRVYVEGNKQALSYACGVLETFDMLYEFERCKLVIVQPRMSNVRETEWLPVELLKAHGRDMNVATFNSRVAFEQVAYDTPINPEFFKASPKGCQWCRAQALCPTFQDFATAEVAKDFAPFPVAETDLLQAVAAVPVEELPRTPAERLGRAYASLPVLEQWIAAVREEVDRQVRAGMLVDGPDGLPLKLVDDGFGKRQWKDPKAAEALLVGVLPPEKAYEPRSIITAPAAAKLLDKKKTAQTWAQFADLIHKPRKPPKVVLGSDPRPVYSGAATASEFTDLSVTE